MTNIILCGGSGTRLWPLSRQLMPKQFVKLFNKESLFQLTVNRNKEVTSDIIIVSNTEQYFLALDQLEELGISNSVKYLLEPIGRNTAPAIALACMLLDKEELVLVTPSDHLIKNQIEYKNVIEKAKQLAKEDYLVTFGITPTSPETGFGYIESKGDEVTAFHEKPNLEIAKKYFKAENFYWNSGMFCFKAGVFLEELEEYSPHIYEKCSTALRLSKRENPIRISHELMQEIPEDSIDYAVMEKSNRVKVIPSTIDWSDLGSFESLDTEIESSSNIIDIDSSNNLVLSNKQVALIDIDNLIVVDTPDALLISKKGSSSKVKQVVKKLNEEGSALTKNHTLTHRPWGTYEVLLSTDKYKIKRIVVQPNKRLSLQKHYHRNEHWIVVSGTATVRVGDDIKLIRPNESTYIKMGEIHRLENEGKIPVVLIEAQVGEYTHEDDIVRIEDDYKRGDN
ncbi:MAG: Mannose-1-phosphate guanylyltransferase (GDP) (EC [uncultured Sulfurovum sp.]|uniref:mannose-1-phosphate guanylyltransferase n=1 Tax=uncultured Sulfurovum sp. TaxID=269237 RepID=A0A6S6TH22_9BACT|nr:MAG: Mannose-1-phosphate guanylyltransferase (GDP) (EC [uncultured Sulfurovum sp.]